MNDRKTTNILLLIIVIPLIFYLLKTLSFIFIPLVAAMFIALLFLPLMRWLKRKGVPKPLSILIVVLIMIAFGKLTGVLIQLSSREILATNDTFSEKAKVKLVALVLTVEEFFGFEFLQDEETLGSLVQRDTIVKNFAPTVGLISQTVSKLLTTLFFVILLLAGSIDMQKLLSNTLLKHHFASVKTFMKIERDLIKFIKVKFFVSFLTGLGIGIACWGFGISFPIFWGLFAFAINFLQMIGSVITVVLLALFAFVELDAPSVIFLFTLTTTGVQVLFGGILEPIFMGRSFSINIVTILIMLMLWGYIWGIPGLIMSIPITVFLKILAEQYEGTRVMSELLTGSESNDTESVGDS
ncbi:MAG: AI-2E family transporter [Bacteroidota bacterium]